MNASGRSLIVAALAASLSLSGCAGGAFGQASSWPGLASDGETAFVAADQFVYAVDLGSGVARWRYPAEPERNRTFYAPPAVAEGGTVIVGDFSNQLTALQSESGAVLWGPEPLSPDRNDRVIGAPVAVGELVLAPSTDGRLYARSLSDGSAVWSFPAADQDPLEEAIWAAPLVVDQRVYVAAMDHHIYALDLATGLELWAAAPDLGGAVADTPTPAGDLLLVGSFAGKVVALEAGSGSIRWEYEAEGWVWGAPAVDAEVAYFGDLSGQLHAVSVDRGSPLWSTTIGGQISASPAVDGDLLYVPSENGLLLVRQRESGNPAWQATSQGQLLTDPLLVNGTLLVASNGGEPLLMALDAESGAQRWSFSP